jgi:nitroimidazol reductase NimA-like FMN-containing flavoprotein (pyridoxamine 5'-phosphate oxidase superfamily)
VSIEVAGVFAVAAVAYLALVEPTGPYVVPVNFAYLPTPSGAAGPPEAGPNRQGRIVFHTGLGRKTAALDRDPRVCLAMVVDPAFQSGPGPCQDSFAYRSVLVWGRAERLRERADRETALGAIVRKYDPAAAGKALDEAELARTLVYQVQIESLSYKGRPGPG